MTKGVDAKRIASVADAGASIRQPLPVRCQPTPAQSRRIDRKRRTDREARDRHGSRVAELDRHNRSHGDSSEVRRFRVIRVSRAMGRARARYRFSRRPARRPRIRSTLRSRRARARARPRDRCGAHRPRRGSQRSTRPCDPTRRIRSARGNAAPRRCRIPRRARPRARWHPPLEVRSRHRRRFHARDRGARCQGSPARRGATVSKVRRAASQPARRAASSTFLERRWRRRMRR